MLVFLLFETQVFVEFDFFFFFFLQYFMNAALARTSVASTTIVFSTSGLFTLLIGALLGEDSINVINLVSVFVSMAGVVMTAYGKTWATDESETTTSSYVSCLPILFVCFIF
jgi:solute carrier family 35 protein F5